MMSDADRKKAAELLLAADKEHKPIELPSRQWPEITIDDAYAKARELSLELTQRVDDLLVHIGQA